MNELFQPLASITTPDKQDIERRAKSALEMVKSMMVETAGDYELAADELRAIKQRQKALEEERTKITKPLNAVVKAVNDLFRAPGDFLDQAESIIKNKMLAYTKEQQRIEDERRIEAEKQAAAERERLENEAKAMREAALKEAQQSSGDSNSVAAVEEKAAQIEMQAALVSPVVIQAETPKVQGISRRAKTVAEVVDKKALVKHIAENEHLLDLLVVDSVKLRQMANALGENLNLPGVSVTKEDLLAIRA